MLNDVSAVGIHASILRTMASPTGKLPQWWLDCTPHDTLEEQVERKKKEEEEKQAQQEADEKEESSTEMPDDSDAALEQEEPLESLDMNGDASDDSEASPVSEKNRYRRNSNSRSPMGPPEEYPESTDYNAERAKLRHVENQKKRNVRSPSDSTSSYAKPRFGRYVRNDTPSPKVEAAPESAPTPSPLSPESNVSNKTPSTQSPPPKPVRKFKTVFTGVSPFDFAMQQRAREQERREKERLARESLARHHAEKVESDKASQQKQKHLEEMRKKKEAEEAIKKFRKTTLDADLETELKRQKQEEKRKKKEAEEQHHGYKSTS